MQMCCSLAVTGTMNYVRQKIDKHIENNVFSCAVHIFTRTPPMEILSHNSSKHLFCIPCIETHTPIALLGIIQTFIVHSYYPTGKSGPTDAGIIL